MVIVFICCIVLFFKKSKVFIKDFNINYLDKENTSKVNGMFVIIIFFSHFYSYIKAEHFLDTTLSYILNILGQLMVTTFLFFSGYGIFESIKRKREYMKTFFQQRFLVTLINFEIAVFLFFILNMIMQKEISLSKFFLSLIGWDSLGNSNWYMMTIFVLYIFTMISFYKTKNHKKSIILLSIFSIIYVIIISKFKEQYWCNTLLCFPAGLWYSYYKDKIDSYIQKNNRNYITILLLNTLLLGLMFVVNTLIK